MGIIATLNQDVKRLSFSFGGVAGLLPGGKAAQQRRNARETIAEQDERRTGAGFFCWSGTVGNNPRALF